MKKFNENYAENIVLAYTFIKFNALTKRLAGPQNL